MINKFSYAIDLAYPRSIDLTVMHGESIELDIDITINGEPWTSTSNTIEMLWQEPCMSDSWYTTRASRTGSTVTVDWKGSMDTGAELYRWFIRLIGPGDDQSYRVYGKFRMQKSPGFVPNQLPKPTSTLDFSSFEVVNAPYYTKEYLDAELTRLKEEIAALNGGEISASQIQDKDKTAGKLYVAFDDVGGGTNGIIDFDFDPLMYNEGFGEIELNIGPYAPPAGGIMLANNTIRWQGTWKIASFTSNGRLCFFTDTPALTEGDNKLYFYCIILNHKNEGATLFYGVSPVRDLQIQESEISQNITMFGDAMSSFTQAFEYQMSGNYKLITERLLRDTATGEAYTISVTNGELHLTPYRLTQFSGEN